MPAIPEYFAPNSDLNPSAVGASAWEQAGRRIGPLFNEAATFKQREGALAAQAEKEKMWPFDIQALYSRRAVEDAAANKAQADHNTVNLRVANGGRTRDPFAESHALNDGWTPGYNDLGQVSRGAAALGQAVSDGGYGVAKGKPAAPGAPAGGGGFGEDYTLLNGQFVSASDARKIDAQERAKADDWYKSYGENLGDYYSRYYGYAPSDDTSRENQQGGYSPSFGGTGGRSNMNPYSPSPTVLPYGREPAYGGATYNQNPPAGGGGFWQGIKDFIGHSSAAGYDG